ncbi:MAG: hypothetical protein GY694_18420 [Gammaproteobacteria bacterium]|nr:hypothetical protein [Gammaproteobacteria bacterium]
MKTPKLLKAVKRFLSADKKNQYEKIQCFTDILKKLKKKQEALKKNLASEKNENKRKKIKKKLAIIYAQRKKGITALKEVKK